MSKSKLLVVGVLIAGLIAIIFPFLYDSYRSVAQRQDLQDRKDFPQIATACAALLKSSTNDAGEIPVDDPRVPALLRSLSPRTIMASSNHVTLEFHGGFDHYGYKFRPADSDPKQWSLYFYTEGSERLLTTTE